MRLPTRPPGASLHQPSDGDVREAVKALLGAGKPLIWAGAGVMFAGATAALREFAELVDVPVYTSMPGKSGFDERHPLSVGCGGLTVAGPARKMLDACDVMLAIGASLTETPYAQSVPEGKVLIHAVLNPEEINKDTVAAIGPGR